jgi:PAS domain S-box-containing protein
MTRPAAPADGVAPKLSDGLRPNRADDEKTRIKVELLKIAHQNSQIAVLSTLIALPVVVLLIWHQGAPETIWVWTAAVVAVTLLRALNLRLIPAHALPVGSVDNRLRQHLLWTSASGAAWGAAALLSMPDSLPNQVFLTLILGGIICISVVLHAAMFQAVALFALAALLPMIVRLYLEGSPLHVAMSIACAVFLVVLMAIASRIQNMHLNTIRLKLANDDLVSHLERTAEATEQLNSTLTAEIAERRGMEARLRVERDFISAILDTECGIVIVLSPEGRIVRFNRACEAATGYYAHEVVGRPIWDTLIPPSDSPYLRWKLDAVLSGSFPNECEIHWNRKQGDTRRVRLSNTALLDKTGKPTHIVATGIDVTEHYVAEKELARTREDFRLLVEGVSSYAIYMLDTEGRITSWNTGAEHITGYTVQDVIGTHFSRFYTPEDIERDRPSLQMRMAASDGRNEYEGWNVRKGGDRFWAAITVSPVRGPDQKLRGYSVITGDLTQRKQTEETIRALLTITEQLNATLDIDLLMESLVRQSLILLDAAGGYADLFHGDAFDYRHYCGEGAGLSVPGLLNPADGLPAHVRRTGKPYRSAAPADDPLSNRAFYRLRNIRSAICCPILDYDGNVIGFIELHNKHRESHFSATDEERLVSVSHSASLAIQNALAYQQINRTKNLLAEETRLLEIIATGSTLDEIIIALLKSLEKNIEGAAAAFLTFDTEDNTLSRWETPHPGQLAAIPPGTAIPTGVQDAGQRLSRTDAAPIFDITHNAAWRRALLNSDDRAAGEGQFWLCPIRTNASAQAHAIVMRLPRDSSSSPESIALAETATHLAGIAIERRQAEERLRLQEQAVVSSVNAILVISLAVEGYPVLYANPAATRITGLAAADLLGRSWLSICDHADNGERIAALHATLAERKEGHAILQGRRPDGRTFWAEVFLSPVLDSAGNVSHFVAVMHDISDRLQAETELRQSRERLRALSTHLQTVREEEKAHLARELHDELGSTLLALKIDASWIQRHLPDGKAGLDEKARAMLTLVDNAVSTTRRISSDLRPPMLDDLGLIPTLEWQIAEFEARTGIECEAYLTGDSELLDNRQSIALFRIFQEAFTNIARHADASGVKVHVDITPEHAIMEIGDDGHGIDPAVARRPNAHGVYGMFERAHSLGGDISFESTPGEGTRLAVRIPLDSDRTEAF